MTRPLITMRSRTQASETRYGQKKSVLRNKSPVIAAFHSYHSSTPVGVHWEYGRRRGVMRVKTTNRILIFLQCAVLVCASWIIYSCHYSLSPILELTSQNTHNVLVDTPHTPFSLSDCTQAQLDAVEKELSPTHCAGNTPWAQKCSITQATKCIEATWLQEHFQQRKGLSTNVVGINVGCNKGFDAIDMARMLSNRKIFDKASWKQAMEHKGTVTSVGCGPQSAQYSIPADAEERSSRVFCVEPMPLTVDALNYSATLLRLGDHGFTVSKAAVSREGGSVAMFPARVKNRGVAQHEKVEVGTENVGLSNVCKKDKDACEEVPVISLDEYVANNVGKGSVIHVLTTDVEGYDYDVLLGGRETLARTEYLEFEYNWIGSWGKQKLRDCIDFLQSLDFTCYWAGMGKLWRITGCWLDHYDFHTWSNVACVNHRRNVDLAQRMEDVFLKTMK